LTRPDSRSWAAHALFVRTGRPFATGDAPGSRAPRRAGLAARAAGEAPALEAAAPRRPITGRLAADRVLHTAFTRERTRRGALETAGQSCASPARGRAAARQSIEVFETALRAGRTARGPASARRR
jgi:hypothetical protein